MWHHLICKPLDLLHSIGPAWGHELEGDVVYADVAIGSEGLYQLCGGAAQVAFVLGYGLGG